MAAEISPFPTLHRRSVARPTWVVEEDRRWRRGERVTALIVARAASRVGDDTVGRQDAVRGKARAATVGVRLAASDKAAAQADELLSWGRREDRLGKRRGALERSASMLHDVSTTVCPLLRPNPFTPQTPTHVNQSKLLVAVPDVRVVDENIARARHRGTEARD